MSSSHRPCTTCGRKRVMGGQSKRVGLCRLCFHAAKVARPKAVHRCGCGETVSGPGRMCVACSAEHRRGPRAGRRNAEMVPALDRGIAAPSSSWWAVVQRERWSEAIAEQLPRLQAVPGTKDLSRVDGDAQA
jgi:hypothetical protein